MRKRFDWSKVITFVVILFGFLIVQESFILMWFCIHSGYTSTAAWLTAAVGLAEAVIGTGLAGYLSLAKSDHKTGGITFEAAKADNFGVEQNIDSPPI